MGKSRKLNGGRIEKKIWPLLIDDIPADELPVWAEEIQYFDFTEDKYDIVLNILISSLIPPNPLQDLLDAQILMELVFYSRLILSTVR